MEKYILNQITRVPTGCIHYATLDEAIDDLGFVYKYREGEVHREYMLIGFVDKDDKMIELSNDHGRTYISSEEAYNKSR